MYNHLRDISKKIILKNPTKSNYKFVIKELLSIRDINALSRALESKRFLRLLEQIEMRHPAAKKALILSPHPDDDIFSSGGTMLHLLEIGCEIKVIYLATGTSASSGLASIVECEAQEVAGCIGIHTEFWHFHNRMIPVDSATLEKFRNTVSAFDPDVIFLPFIADDHDDHRKSVQLFYDSFKNKEPLDCEIWAYQVYSTVPANVVVDITDVFNRKMKLIDIYRSRKKSRDWSHYISGMNAMNSRFLKTNEARYAEIFYVVPAKEYIELCASYFDNSLQ